MFAFHEQLVERDVLPSLAVLLLTEQNYMDAVNMCMKASSKKQQWHSWLISAVCVNGGVHVSTCRRSTLKSGWKIQFIYWWSSWNFRVNTWRRTRKPALAAESSAGAPRIKAGEEEEAEKGEPSETTAMWRSTRAQSADAVNIKRSAALFFLFVLTLLN